MHISIHYLFTGILPLINKNMLCNALCPIYKAVYGDLLLSEKTVWLADQIFMR